MIPTPKQRIAIMYPGPMAGGSASVCFWTFQALKDDHNAVVFAFDHAKFEEYGHSLQPTLLRLPFRGGALLRQHLMMNYAKRIALKFDLMIGAFSEMDFGRPGIQYINSPMLKEGLTCNLGQMPDKWYYRDSPLRGIYRTLCEFISGFSEESMKCNLTLVNSNWAGEMVKAVYGIEARTVYPPVVIDFPRIPWEKREKGFICLGRLSPEKQIEKAIEIVRGVRASGWDVHLHILGSPGERRYVEKIERICAQNREWIVLHQNLPRRALTELIARHRYGIHAMPYEPFGIAVAEMVKAGCIAFVPRGGGQVEIVESTLLTYDSGEDAVKKIIAVLSDPLLQHHLSVELQQRAERFSAERFMQAMRGVVAEFLG